MATSKHQKFEVKRVHRRDLRKADYNPRIIRPENEKMLKRSLDALGLVEPLVWNARTGNLVGGHQRITQLDALEGTDDYELDVAVIDVDEHEEKKINLALNNRNIQGDWDEGALSDLLRDCTQADYKDIGVTQADLEVLLGEVSGLAAFSQDTPERAEVKDKLSEIKQDRAAMNQRLAEEQRIDFYAVVIFEDVEEREIFYRELGLHQADKYIRGVDLMRKMKQGG